MKRTPIDPVTGEETTPRGARRGADMLGLSEPRNRLEIDPTVQRVIDKTRTRRDGLLVVGKGRSSVADVIVRVERAREWTRRHPHQCD